MRGWTHYSSCADYSAVFEPHLFKRSTSLGPTFRPIIKLGLLVQPAAEMAKGFLEVFKFGLYVAIPVSMMLVVANPDILERLIRHRPYVVYPPEGPRPPPPEEIREMVRKRKQSKEV